METLFAIGMMVGLMKSHAEPPKPVAPTVEQHQVEPDKTTATQERARVAAGLTCRPTTRAETLPYTCRSTIFFLISAMDFAGLSPFGQALVQFMMVWQR